MLLWLTFVVSAILIYMWMIKPHRYWKERGVIHQTPLPIVGNLVKSFLRKISLPEDVTEVYKKFSDRKYYGYYQYMQAVLVLRDIEIIKQISIKDFDHFTDHNAFIPEHVEPLFGKNLFSLKGQRWRDMRATLSPAFTSSKIKNMFTLMSECAEQFTDHFMMKAAEDPTGAPMSVEMKDVFTRFTNDVIATTAFGVQCNSLKNPKNEFYMMGKDATNFTGIRALRFFAYTISPFLATLFRVKIFSESVRSFFWDLVLTTMETREKHGIVRPDMIHLLMEARKGKLKHDDTAKSDDKAGFATVEESQVGKQTSSKTTEIPDDEIVAQALLFFFAGFDSVSAVMCHMANELAVNPDIQQRLQDEINATYEDGNGKITYEAILKMNYLDMVVSETLRKWPAAIFTDRVCTKSFVIKPVDEEPLNIYKGDVLWLPVFSIHRDPEFFPNPEKFDPERFSDENKDSIKPFSYLPFGVGPRNCIGSRFALLEVKIIFVYLLKKFDLVVTKKTDVPLKLHPSSFNLNALNGFWLGLKPKKNI